METEERQGELCEVVDGGVLETAVCGQKVQAEFFSLKSWSLNTKNVVNRIRTNKHSWCQALEGLGEGSGMGLTGFDIKNTAWRSNMTWFCLSGRKKKMITTSKKAAILLRLSVFPAASFPAIRSYRWKVHSLPKPWHLFGFQIYRWKKKEWKKKRQDYGDVWLMIGLLCDQQDRK